MATTSHTAVSIDENVFDIKTVKRIKPVLYNVNDETISTGLRKLLNGMILEMAQATKMN